MSWRYVQRRCRKHQSRFIVGCCQSLGDHRPNINMPVCRLKSTARPWGWRSLSALWPTICSLMAGSSQGIKRYGALAAFPLDPCRFGDVDVNPSKRVWIFLSEFMTKAIRAALNVSCDICLFRLWISSSKTRDVSSSWGPNLFLSAGLFTLSWWSRLLNPSERCSGRWRWARFTWWDASCVWPRAPWIYFKGLLYNPFLTADIFACLQTFLIWLFWSIW